MRTTSDCRTGMLVHAGLLALACLTSCAGPSQSLSPEERAEIGKYLAVRRALLAEYEEPLDGQLLADKALIGMFEGLDAHSEYFPAYAVGNDLDGTWQSAGLELVVVNDAPHVLYPIRSETADGQERSDAMDAGVQVGDRIIAVNGYTFADPAHMAARSLASASLERGLRLDLRSPDDMERQIGFKPERPKNQHVRWVRVLDRSKRLGYIYLAAFNETAATEFRAALKSLPQLGIEHFILDLRGNPGGDLQAFGVIADCFLQGGLLVSQEFARTGQQIESRANLSSISQSTKLVLLVDAETASAAELLAATLRERRGVPIVGQKTYGKGVFQVVRTFADGSSFRITAGSMTPPSGLSFNKRGIAPDRQVYVDESLAALLRRSLRRSEPPQHLQHAAEQFLLRHGRDERIGPDPERDETLRVGLDLLRDLCAEE